MNRHLQRDLNGAMLFTKEGKIKMYDAHKVVQKLNLNTFFGSEEELVKKIVEYLNNRFPGQYFTHERNRR